MHRFTHETEKDKTGNVFLGPTKLGIRKLGMLFGENPFCENLIFMENSNIPKYEKLKTRNFLCENLTPKT